MRAPRSWLLAACLVGLAMGCSRTIIGQPVHRAGDSWDFTLRKLTDGPNGYSTGNGSIVPEKGGRFIWAHITLHNPARQPRKFNFDRCELDDGGETVLPSIIDMDWIVHGSGSREPELAPDETITRQLIFTYPQNRSPTRLTCLPMVIPLPQF